jgi:hypothetical protein
VLHMPHSTSIPMSSSSFKMFNQYKNRITSQQIYNAFDCFFSCSTAAAMAWDESFRKMADPSGRAVLNVHTKAYETNGVEEK